MPDDIWEEPDVQAWLARSEAKVRPMIAESVCSIVIAPAEPDAKAAVELGFMILLDKPIIVVAVDGRQVPPKLAAAADAVIVGDMNDPKTRADLEAALRIYAPEQTEENQ